MNFFPSVNAEIFFAVGKIARISQSIKIDIGRSQKQIVARIVNTDIRGSAFKVHFIFISQRLNKAFKAFSAKLNVDFPTPNNGSPAAETVFKPLDIVAKAPIN